ncbi:MAG: hypothetical protein EBY15_09320 [Gammaproteobacteria bacterium]|nr:hypothetical protein [Gammaproteobacteria bacterium]NDE56904.1 hypothetical protein [Gammaproteobacteria bacterium]NDG88126.1 hypothetical protein [Gammaproteobacteria bacterium]
MTKPPVKKPIRRLERHPDTGSTAAFAESPARQDQTPEEEMLALEKSLVALNIDAVTIERIENLPHDIGWLLFTAGVLGIILPGIIGTPFLIVGSLIIWPGTNQRAERWLKGQSPKMFKGSIRQVNRFLDDLERRYPAPRKLSRTQS